MFTGIVKALCPIVETKAIDGILHLGIELPSQDNLEVGASIAVDGVCLTVTSYRNNIAYFDAIPETLQRTTLHQASTGRMVNIERAARFGDEIGGHILSGHIWGIASIANITPYQGSYIFTCTCPPPWTKYLLPKGYIALDGISLTLASVDPKGEFTVHIIPETFRSTTLGNKKAGSQLNLELDSQTQTIVDTVEAFLSKK